MDKPIPPGDGECCESGCSPCVWDRYYDALRAWEAQQASLKLAIRLDTAGIICILLNVVHIDIDRAAAHTARN
jgi:Oxidoreductase-like protein, N-terminal